MSGLVGLTQSFEDTSFIAGDSPATLNFSAALDSSGRADGDGYIVNDGSGSFTIELSHNGSTYGDVITVKDQEIFHFAGVRRLRITHLGTNSAYRCVVQHSEWHP